MKKNLILLMIILSVFFTACGGTNKQKETFFTNTIPTATEQSITTNEDTLKNITLLAIDADDDNLTYIIIVPPNHGRLNGTTQNLIYLPNLNYYGSDSFTFKVNDGNIDSTIKTINITVNSINDIPTVNAGNDAIIISGNSFTPSSTYSDVDGTIVSIIWKEGDSTLSFPKNDFSIGTHVLSITITDNDGASSTDNLILTVESKPIPCKPLLKTGQTIVYNNHDDGHYQKGATRGYIRDDLKNVVVDNTTELMWQDNEDVKIVQKPYVAYANFNTQDYNNTSGDTATTYCTNLTLGGYTDWRLPAIEELIYLTDKGRIDPAIDPIFENTASLFYWSSTTLSHYSHGLWYASFYSGSEYWSRKDDSFYVRCVRDTIK